jgi:NAD(P)-dependent dehydrogenase (short-subunit alcohol dehydrogenase family)
MMNHIDSRFAGQTAVITGGADGLGKAIAHRLAREGAAVTLFDLDADKLTATSEAFVAEGLTVYTEVVDITSDEAVQVAMQRVAACAGQLDVVVHCAGIVGPNGKPITQVPTEAFDLVYRVNLRGTFIVIKHALTCMLPSNYGRILVFASIAGKEGNAGMACYSAMKAGVIGLVKSVGKEFAETGITINAIAPAVIRTTLVEAMEPHQVTYMTDKIPMRRCGTLDEVASLSCWIVSKEAGFNTGFTFDLSGGRATY